MYAAALVGLFAAAMWFAWLGWDHEYYEADGVAHGPYRSWQVIGCGATIAGASILTYVNVRRRAAVHALAFAAASGLAVPWGVDASSDETGLWVFGLMAVLIGATVAIEVLLHATEAEMKRRDAAK